MRYYKMMDGNYVRSIGTTTGQPSNPITKEEYDLIMDMITHAPAPADADLQRVRILQTDDGFEYRTVDVTPEVEAVSEEV